jgi:hypothetical protein
MIEELSVASHQAQALDLADGEQKAIERILSLGPRRDFSDSVSTGNGKQFAPKPAEPLLELGRVNQQVEFTLPHLDRDLPKAGDTYEYAFDCPFLALEEIRPDEREHEMAVEQKPHGQ